MTEKYTAIITNDHYTFHKKYWKITIEANSLNELNNICSAINLIKNGGVKND